VSEVVQNFALPTGKQLHLFLYVALGWLICGASLSFWLETQQEVPYPGLALGAVVGLWTLSLLDLVALTRLLGVVFKWMSPNSGNPAVFFIQTLFWGALKLVCLGLFFITLLKGQKIPMHGLLLGMATLGVVPVVGGFIWSQRISENA
jgi:hypothetical protein